MEGGVVACEEAGWSGYFWSGGGRRTPDGFLHRWDAFRVNALKSDSRGDALKQQVANFGRYLRR